MFLLIKTPPFKDTPLPPASTVSNLLITEGKLCIVGGVNDQNYLDYNPSFLIFDKTEVTIFKHAKTMKPDKKDYFFTEASNSQNGSDQDSEEQFKEYFHQEHIDETGQTIEKSQDFVSFKPMPDPFLDMLKIAKMKAKSDPAFSRLLKEIRSSRNIEIVPTINIP